MTTHIVAMGGGGFSSSEGYRATALDRYVLSLSEVEHPLVCFVPTASADNGLYVSRFMNAYSHEHSRTSVLTLWEGAADAINRLDEVDVFMVGGGNTVNLYALWAAHGLTRRFLDIAADPSHNVVLAGMGAGAAIWHEACTTDGFGRGVEAYRNGLGLVPGSFCPHYDGEADRAPKFSAFIDASELPNGWGVDNGAAIHYVDGQITEFVTETPGAAVYRVEQDENGAKVTKQEMTQL